MTTIRKTNSTTICDEDGNADQGNKADDDDDDEDDEDDDHTPTAATTTATKYDH